MPWRRRGARRGHLILASVAAAAHQGHPDPRHGSNDHHGDSGDHHGDQGASQPATYAVIGDTPYGQPQVENSPNDISEINADLQVRLVMHLGDIKNGSSQCSTRYFEQIRADFNNEWTDCHRADNGAYWPAGAVLNGDTRPARLDKILRIFSDRPGWTLGQHPRRIETQGGNYVENVMWSQSQVEIGDLSVPGSNSDWLPWFGQPQTSSQIEEVSGRTHAELVWMDRIFDRARDEHAKAVAIGIQADMWDPAIEGDPTQYDHFQPNVQALAREAQLPRAGPADERRLPPVRRRPSARRPEPAAGQVDLRHHSGGAEPATDHFQRQHHPLSRMAEADRRSPDQRSVQLRAGAVRQTAGLRPQPLPGTLRPRRQLPG